MVYAFSLKSCISIKENAYTGSVGNLAGSQQCLKKKKKNNRPLFRGPETHLSWFLMGDQLEENFTISMCLRWLCNRLIILSNASGMQQGWHWCRILKAVNHLSLCKAFAWVYISRSVGNQRKRITAVRIATLSKYNSIKWDPGCDK